MVKSGEQQANVSGFNHAAAMAEVFPVVAVCCHQAGAQRPEGLRSSLAEVPEAASRTGSRLIWLHNNTLCPLCAANSKRRRRHHRQLACVRWLAAELAAIAESEHT